MLQYVGVCICRVFRSSSDLIRNFGGVGYECAGEREERGREGKKREKKNKREKEKEIWRESVRNIEQARKWRALSS